MNTKKIVPFILPQLLAFGLFTSLSAHAATPILTSIAVTPVNHTISLDESLQYTPTGTFSDGTSRTLIGGLGTWADKASMAGPRAGHAVGVVNGILYAVGGYAGVALATVEAYNPVTNTWTPRASMSAPRALHAVGVVNGVLYAVGGYNDTNFTYLASVEAYDPATDTWTTMASMSTPRGLHAVGVMNGVLYAAGGWNGSATLATMEAYDPATNTWVSKASMRTARYGHAGGVVNGRFYVVGGTSVCCSSVLATVSAYNPATNIWTAHVSMPTGRYQPAVGVVNGTLYVMGGSDNGDIMLATVVAYKPGTGEWATKASMSTPRWELGVGVVNGILYAGGGLKAFDSYLATVEAYTPPDEIIWSSNTTSVATITQSGVAVGVGVGQTSITATSGSISGSTSLMVVDTVPPTVPTDLIGIAVSPTQINLTWTASTDNVGVTGYKVYRDGLQVGTPSGTSYSDTSLTAATYYSYTVAAFDAAGNLSGLSPPISVHTVDNIAPTAPTGIGATAVSRSQINLSWTAANDSIGVVGYKIERCTGSKCTAFAQVGTSTTTSFSNTGLAAKTTYRYRVRAYDAAGNNSAYSSIVAAATLR